MSHIEECTEQREQRQEWRYEQREIQHSRRCTKCRRGKWWDPRTWFCWIHVALSWCWEWFRAKVWVWFEWIECVIIPCPDAFPADSPTREYLSAEPIRSNLDVLHRDSNGESIFTAPSHLVNFAIGQPRREIRFLGTNAVYITDGTTRLMIDPYFTRPAVPALVDIINTISPAKVCCRIRPDDGMVRKTLQHVGIDSIDAIFATHAHYDHALDIPSLARVMTDEGQSSPHVYGSTSIRHIALGGGVSDATSVLPHMRYSKDTKNNDLGDFAVTFIPGEHQRMGIFTPYAGKIEEPVYSPAPVHAYRMGEFYNILIEHGDVRFLIHSCNCKKEALAKALNGKTVDYLFLSSGGFSSAVNKLWHRDKFFEQVVVPASPKTIFLTHWDDYRKRLDNSATWISILDDPPSTHQFLTQRNAERRQAGLSHASRIEFLRVWGLAKW